MTPEESTCFWQKNKDRCQAKLHGQVIDDENMLPVINKMHGYIVQDLCYSSF